MQLERIRDRRKDMLILQGESRKCPKVFKKCPYSRPSKVVVIWTSFAKALVTYLPGPMISLNLKYFPFILCV